MTVFALLRGIFVDSLLHVVVESGLHPLYFLALDFGDVVPGLLVEVKFLIVLGQFESGDLALQQSLLGLPAALPAESVADGQHFLVHDFVLEI